MVESGEESWAMVLDRLGAVLLCEDPVSMQPLLVTAALRPVGYLPVTNSMDSVEDV